MENKEPVNCSNAVRQLSRQTFPVLSLKGDVNQETLFSLEELAHSDVFNVKSDWSDDITSLRQLAIQKPQIISESFIFQHFTTLRLVDRNINEVDRGLLKFTNLQELSLTGNRLTSVVGAHLPKSLTVLQLFANKFTDLQDLTINPPPNLQHLGVGYNQLSDLSSYMSPYHWPNLLSLDLSHNKIGHVMSTLQTLSELLSLRNLSLIANPITLAPGYRGCTLDMIPQLQILDDVSISDDDRLHFTNISRESVNWDEAIFTIVIPELENLRLPPENEPIDDSSFHYPAQKKYSYSVRFNFVSDTDDTISQCDPTSPEPHTMQEQESRGCTPKSRGCSSKSVRVADFPPAAGLKPSITATPPSPASKEIIEATEAELSREEPELMGILYETESIDHPWEENPKFTKPVIVKCSKLTLLEEFLQGEIQFSLVEKVVESFTAIAPPDPATPTPTPTGKKKDPTGGKDDKKKKKDGKAPKPMTDKDGNILKWVDGAPVYNEIGHIRVDLKTILAVGSAGGKIECTMTEKPPPATPLPEEGRTSVASGKGGKASKKGGKKKVVTPVPIPPPAPLKMEYQIDMVKWNNIQDCRTWNQVPEVPDTANGTVNTGL